ncbi:AMP-binding protein [Acuticoccus mangrovi]|uniref:AMP-binding protein n=1 Tax=Acuticoccus mangrovi TaxID=2796142 RepID=A0A934ID92_9HYPH|nr:AMP-binding protein [Acuticoccus mangrovi]MBJ3774409.1 AMP-binding protein [Acuticoccus mangrovi]
MELPPRADGPQAADIERKADLSVLSALLLAARTHGGPVVAVEDGDRRTLTYTGLIRAVSALSRVIRRETRGEVVAIMLPSSVAAVVAYFAVLAAGRIPAMLNFTAGRRTLLGACRLANVGAILTADRFVQVAQLETLVGALSAAAPVFALESLRERVRLRDKAFAVAAAPAGLLPRREASETAAIIFTSGAEGDPKGVVLSHRNILANIAQVEAGLPLERAQVFFNPLPVFHSYGLVPGMILPLVLGRKLVLHPSPLRAKEVAKRIAETKPNVLLATDTFLRQYARAGDPGSLSSLHFAVCGAERVRTETRDLVRSRFGFEVVEGYGVTETSPVLAVNHPDDIRDGTVGRLLHGIAAQLEPVPGLSDGWRLKVRGPNVMEGYLQPDGRIRKPPDGWHDTGDIVAFEDGYLAIRGRLKRFAKIGGEMTSLVMVENIAGQVWPDSLHAAAAIPVGPKGEAIILLTEEKNPDPAKLLARIRAEGLPDRFVPYRILEVDAVPLLGTGKLDTVAATQLAGQRLAEADARADFNRDDPGDDDPPQTTSSA